MSHIFKPISKKQFIANRNNIKCHLNLDTNKFNNVLSNYSHIFRKPFTIICALADTTGFGDVIFFVKFIKYLLNQYHNIKISIMISERKKKLITSIFNPRLIYDCKTVKTVKIDNYGNDNIALYIGTLIGNNNDGELKTDMKIYGDIMFVPPRTNTTINIQYENRETIANNSYTLSEYNPLNHDLEATINTGINQAGLLLNNYKNRPNIETMAYSMTYLYVGDDYIEEYEFVPSLIKFKIDNDNVWNLETLCHRLEIDLENEDIKDENYQEFLQFTELHDYIVRIKLVIVFRDYLNDLDIITPEKIKVYYRGESVDYIKDIMNDLSFKDIQILNLQTLYDYLFVTDRFVFTHLTSKTHDEMLVLYQHSLPVIFISGDQSISDFIYVNNYYTDKQFKHDIYYQIFSWKQKFADSLGCKDFICGKIPKKKLNEFAHNPKYDFRYRGMLYVHSALIYALEYKLRNIAISKNLCYGIDSSDNIKSIINRYDGDFIETYIDYTTNGTLNNNMSFKIKKQKLIIEQNNNPFKLSMILGNITTKASWLMGSDLSDLHVLYTEGERDNTNKVTKKCNKLTVVLSEDQSDCVILEQNINTLLIYILLEEIRQERIIDNHLARTFGSFVITEKCHTEIKQKLNIKPDANSVNTLLFVENIQDKYMNLKEYLQTDYDINIIHSVLKSVVYIINVLQYSKYKIVHNNLLCENIFIEFKSCAQPIVKIGNFSKASYNIKDRRFASVYSNQLDFSLEHDLNIFFKDVSKYVPNRLREYV